MTLVSIIIPVFNQTQMTEACLSAIARFSEYEKYEVILIDNGSEPSLASALCEQRLPHNTKIIRLEENTGFSYASNLGAELSEGEVLIFLNNDTLPRRRWIAPLVAGLHDQDVGVVGSKLVYPRTNLINHAGYVFSSEIERYYPLYQYLYSGHEVFRMERKFPAVLGAALAIRREIFQEVGGFAQYGLEDIDLCLKVREQTQLHTTVIPDSVVGHFGSYTFKNESHRQLPQTSHHEFLQKWPRPRKEDVDTRYYEADGFTMRWADASTITLCHKTDSSFEFLLLGSEARSRGDLDAALTHLTQAIEINPFNKHSLVELIYTFAQKREYLLVADALEQLLIIDPYHFEAYSYGVQIYLALNQLDKAEALRQTALSQEYLPFDLANFLSNPISDLRSGDCHVEENKLIPRPS